MARIQQSSQEDLEKKLSRMENRLKKSNKKMFSCFNCLLYLLLLLIIGAGCVGYAVAKSGIAEVPILSKKLYTPPSYAYKVGVGGVEQEINLLSQLKSQTQGAFTRGVKEVTVSLDLSEAMLTNELLKQLEKDESISWAQVAVMPTHIEVYIDKGGVIMIMTAVPVAKKGALKLDVTSVRIGQLVLWDWVGKGVVSLALDGVSSLIATVITPIGKVQEVSLEQGYMTLDVSVHYSSQLLNAF